VSRNSGSLKHALTVAWQSSKVPRREMLWMLGSVTVIICSSCVSDVFPSGYMMKHSTPDLPRSPWIADDPVSPDVAPTTVMRLPGRSERRCSKRLPRNWSATSLNANVGPWNSSSVCIPSVIGTVGVTSASRNVPYERAMMSLSLASGTSSGPM